MQIFLGADLLEPRWKNRPRGKTEGQEVGCGQEVKRSRGRFGWLVFKEKPQGKPPLDQPMCDVCFEGHMFCLGHDYAMPRMADGRKGRR